MSSKLSLHGQAQFNRSRLLRTTEAARYLGIGTKALRLFVASGQIPWVQLKPGNSPFLFDVRDLDRFIEAKKSGPSDNSHQTRKRELQ